MPRRLRVFVAVAVLATAIDLFGYLGLQELGFRWWAADAAALTAAAVFGISAHRRITLRNDPNLRWIHRPVAFISSSLIAGLLDVFVLYLASDKGWTSKLVAIGVAAIVRAVSNRYVLFGVVRSEQSAPSNRPAPTDPLRLSIVVPAFREAEHITATVNALDAHLREHLEADDFEIIVVDDGSGDGTADVVNATGLARGILLPENLGKGGAVRAGMLAAQGRSRVFLDADLAYQPAEATRIMTELEQGWDVVVGSRRESRLVTNTGAGLVRDVGGRLVNLTTHLLLLGQYRDTQAGCKGFRSDVAILLFSASRLNGFSFDIEILHLVERWRLTLKELPMSVSATGRSTVNVLGDTVHLLADLGRIRRWSARGVYVYPEGFDPLPDAIEDSVRHEVDEVDEVARPGSLHERQTNG